MRKLYSKETEPLTGGEGKITLSKSEHDKLINDSQELVKLKESAGNDSLKVKQLEEKVIALTGERDTAVKNHSDLESSIKAEYLEQLSDEHKKIAELIPGIESLKQYVKLNAAKPPAGSDSARPGAGAAELNSKWDDLTYDEKEELRRKRPELWRKLYREKFGFN